MKRPSAGPSRKPNSSWTKPNRLRYSPVWASEERLGAGMAYLDGFVGTTGFSIFLSWLKQVGPLAGLEHGERLLAELVVVAEQRCEAHVDVVVVVAHREGLAAEVEQGDDLVGLDRALEAHQPPHGLFGDPAGLLVADDRGAVDGGDVHRVARGVVGHVAGAGEEAVAALEAGDRGPQAGVGEVCQRGQHAAVDLARADVRPPAVVDLDALVREHPLLQQGLRQEEDLADRHAVGPLAVEHVAARGAVDGGGLEQLPAVEDGLGVDLRRALARGPDGEVEMSPLALLGAPDPAEHGAADHVRALAQLPQLDVLGLGVERAREVVLVGLEAALTARLGLEELVQAAGLAGAAACRDARTAAA